MYWKVVGIDLTSMQKKPSTIAIISEDMSLHIYDINTFPYLVKVINENKPQIISVDSPLQYPREGAFRDCDILMKREGIRPLPPTWRGMKKLVDTAIKLQKAVNRRLIECFPTGAISLAYGRLRKEEYLRVFLGIINGEGLEIRTKFRFTKDALDALICAITALYARAGRLDKLMIFEGKECKVYLPRLGRV